MSETIGFIGLGNIGLQITVDIAGHPMRRALQLFLEGQGNPQELLAKPPLATRRGTAGRLAVVHNEAERPRFGLLPQRHLLQSLLLQGCPVTLEKYGGSVLRRG